MSTWTLRGGKAHSAALSKKLCHFRSALFLGFRFSGSGVQGFRVYGSGFRVQGLGFRGLGFRAVSGST